MPAILKVAVLGANPGGEVWSINPVFRDLTAGPIPSSTQLNAMVTAINAIAISSGLLTYMATGTTVTGCRVESRDLTGTLHGLAEGNRGAPVVGTGSTPHPMQTSAVISLRTNVPGAKGRGRLYWPATGVGLAAGTLRINSAATNSFVLGAKTYLAAIKTAINGTLAGHELVVWSRTTATEALVTKLLAGDVPDTQRRRRDTQIESYSETPWP